MTATITVLPRAVLTSAAAILLGAAAAAWCAWLPGPAPVPAPHGAWSGFVLFLVILCLSGGALRLAFAAIPFPEDTFLLPVPVRAGIAFVRIVRFPPWEEGFAASALWLEVMRPASPWHTAVLAAVLIAYLLTVHLAESGGSPGLLRSHVPVLAAGACLAALGAGIGMLPGVTPGSGAALLRVIAAVAMILAAGLVLPYARS